MNTNINLDLYKTFYYVAKNESISRAANEMLISQPAISKSIKTLENQLDTTLFLRKRDGVVLTDAGSIFYKKIKNAMELIEAAEKDLQDKNNNENTILNIGASKTIIHEFLMPYIKKFHIENPNVKIRIFTDKTMDLYKKANMGLINIIITNLPANVPENFEQIKIKDLHDVFVANENFSYLKNKTINAKELQSLPLLVLTKGSINRSRFDDACGNLNINITPEMEFGSNTLIKEFAKAGFGIGLLTKEHVQNELNTGKLFEVCVNINMKPKFLGLTYLKDNNNSITNKFIKFIQNNKLEK